MSKLETEQNIWGLNTIEKDLKKLSEAILKTAFEIDKTIGMNAYNICLHCGADICWNRSPDDICHATDCVVNLAKKYLA